jgi:hypothetical protein
MVGTNAFSIILYRGGTGGPTKVTGGLSHLGSSRVLAFSDHDGDGRPDVIGMDNSTGEATIQWAGSDGTTDPRAFLVRLPPGATFTGQLVR